MAAFPPAFIDYHIPLDWRAGQSISSRSYTVVRLPAHTWGFVERMPTAFTLSGSNDGGRTWVELDSRENVDWTEAASLTFPLTLGEGFRSYRFTALKSSSKDSSPVGVGELIYSGEIYDASSTLVVDGSPLQLGEVVPAYGPAEDIAVGRTITCSATEFATGLPVRYRCAGHVLSPLDSPGDAPAVTNPAISFQYVHKASGARLTWIWEETGYAVSAEPESSLESVSFAPVPDVDGCYPAGTDVTLTAHPSETAPRSTFVKWTGDVPAGHEADNPLTITVDGPKALVPVFRRDWTVCDETPPTIYDGVWKLRLTKRQELAGGYALGNGSESETNAYVAGTGDLDLTEVERCTGFRIVDVTSAAFSGFSGIRSVVFPPTLLSIGREAFARCSNLEDVVLPDSLRSLGFQAFADCPSLASVSPFLPASVESIAEKAFTHCGKLGGALALVNPSLRELAPYVFNGTGITNASLPGVRAIGKGAFINCSKLEEVRLSPVLESVGVEAFSGCITLKRVLPRLLPATVSSLGSEAFYHCYQLEGPLYLENKAITVLPWCAFSACRGIETFFLPPCVAVIGPYAFAKGHDDAKFYFPGHAPEKIETDAFFAENKNRPYVVYGSLRVDPEGWLAFATPLTEEDKAKKSYPGPKTFGTFVSGSRNWLVDWRSPLDPKGTLLLLR